VQPLDRVQHVLDSPLGVLVKPVEDHLDVVERLRRAGVCDDALEVLPDLCIVAPVPFSTRP
jgi:hypothetical protein